MNKRINPWYTYILRCVDDTLYTGIANNLTRRVKEHNESDRLGARYTRGRRPVVLVYSEMAKNRSQALRREHQIRQLTRREKERLIQSNLNPGL